MVDFQGNMVKLDKKANADIALCYRPIATVHTNAKERFGLTLGSLKAGVME